MHTIDTKLNIYSGIFTIGRNLPGEKAVLIQGLLFEPSTLLNLVLHLKVKSKYNFDNLTVKFQLPEFDISMTDNNETEDTSEDDYKSESVILGNN